MAFRDLGDVRVAKPIVLPIRGKEYAFPGEISARLLVRLGVMFAQLEDADGDDADLTAEALSDAEEADLRKALFGDVEAEMIADYCTPGEIGVAFTTLMAAHCYGIKAAEAVWSSPGEAPAPNRAARRKKTPATLTRSRGSRGTSRPRKKTASPGEPSSDSGDSSKPT